MTTTNSELSWGATLLLTAVIVVAFAPIPVTAGEERDIADLDLQTLLDVVLSASKHEETLEEAPANVFIVTRDMIEDYACRSIAEALSLVPGVHITEGYSHSQIGVRGVSNFGDWNSQIMLLIDGRPTTEQYGGTHSIDVSSVTIGNIDRIEFIKGPASSLYGSNAFFGIINLITAVPEENSLVVNSSYFWDTEHTGNSARLLHQFDNDLSVFVTGSWLDRKGSDLYFKELSVLAEDDLALDDDGYYQYYLDSNSFTGGVAQHMNTMEDLSTTGKIKWRELSLGFRFARTDNGIPHGFYGALFNRPENSVWEQRYSVDLAYSGTVSTGFELTTRLSYNHYSWWDKILYNYYEWEAEPDYLPGPIWKDSELNESYGLETRANVDFSEKNTAVLGAEVQFHKIRHESGEADATGDNIVYDYIPKDNAQNEGQVYNVYAQDEHQLSDKLKLVGGLHFNHYTYTTGKVMPKAAIIFRPNYQSTVKLVASRGFRSPSFYEITFDDGFLFIANEDLEPQLITSYELILSHEFPFGFSAQMAGNLSQMTDLIVQTVIDDTDPAHPGGDYLEEVSQFRNLGEMSTQSVELSLHRSPIYGLGGFANVTYQKATVKGADEDVLAFNSPKWLGNFGLTYQVVPGRFSVSSKVNYVSTLKCWDGSFLDERFVIDANLSFKKVAGFFDAALGVKNILDEEYSVPLNYDYAPTVNIRRPGRSVYAELSTSVGW
ncbi:MAG: TonB-dependent receptor [candidate division Zixibacteria bacterium]|nr:TonB-dependent receptor [candidate division Zixibacteria bacterium]MDH3936792.1 TonB-dependent receptor [candidate division Zixibacteria bacterium]MDH4032439.1 TonB-dependent receptor [candidate division Zixibacteria bacterium]